MFADGRKGVVFVLAAAVFMFFSSISARAAEKQEVDVQEVAKEVMKMNQDGGTITLAIWFPAEYIELLMSKNPQIPQEQISKLAEGFRHYTIIGAAEGKAGFMGGVQFKSEAEVRKTVQLIDSKGHSYDPLAEDDIDTTTRAFLGAFKPGMENAIGPLGKNMAVLVFPAKAKDSVVLADPKSKGTFTIKVGKRKFRWKLPLGSLLPPKICPQCNESCSGAWEFCPWCGTKLDKK